MSRPRVLLAHPWMGRGGSEATAMWTLDAMQNRAVITFTTASPLSDADWTALNKTYGTAVDPNQIEVIQAPRLPTVNDGHRFSHLQRALLERHCQQLAPSYDLCISAYNPIDFGKPGIQLVGDFSFSEPMRKRLYIHGGEQFTSKESPWRKAYIGLGDFLCRHSRALSDRGDLILANSDWCRSQLQRHFGVSNAEVLSPPVTLPSAPENVERDPFGFACLGRIVPEKELDRLIDILSAVRKRGFSVHLALIGDLDGSAYATHIAQRVAGHDWIRPTGFLDLEAKREVLAQQTFAIHGCRIEAFGIAVAEMAAMGCIPFVPDSGGASEVVDLPELQFGNEQEAVEKIVSLLEDKARVPKLANQIQERVGNLGPDSFQRGLIEHTSQFLKSPRTVAHQVAAFQSGHVVSDSHRPSLV
ncbi:MAG: glycosyltransferase family 4 protein [Verrucomicrobiota bacterium]